MNDDVKKKILECVEGLKANNISILKNDTNDCRIYGLLTYIALLSAVVLLSHIFLCGVIGFNLTIESHKVYLLNFYIITLIALSICGVGMFYIYHIHSISIFHKTNKLIKILIWMEKNT